MATLYHAVLTLKREIVRKIVGINFFIIYSMVVTNFHKSYR